MFLPFFTQRPTSNKKLYRRRSGGGGHGSSAKGGSSGKGGTTGKSGSGGTTKSIPLSSKAPGDKSSATAYGGGGGKVTTIPLGSPFAGRTIGGGTRGEVFGTRCVKQYHILVSLCQEKNVLTLFFLAAGHTAAAILEYTDGALMAVDSRSISGL